VFRQLSEAGGQVLSADCARRFEDPGELTGGISKSVLNRTQTGGAGESECGERAADLRAAASGAAIGWSVEGP
jgi:hypothetical protein